MPSLASLFHVLHTGARPGHGRCPGGVHGCCCNIIINSTCFKLQEALDVWALGVMAFELLTESRVFSALDADEHVCPSPLLCQLPPLPLCMHSQFHILKTSRTRMIQEQGKLKPDLPFSSLVWGTSKSTGRKSVFVLLIVFSSEV
jgi:hypothetical protein